MVGSRGPRALVAIGVVAISIVAVSMLSPFAVASDHTDPPPDGETVQVAPDVHVWERAILTTRADTDDAVLTVDNADWTLRSPAGDEASLNRDPIPVYKADKELSLEFDEDNANKGGVFDGEDVEVIRAHVQESADGSVPSSPADAVDLLDVETANDQAEFESLGVHTIEGDGTLTVEDTPEEPGQYAYFVATEDGDGFDVTDGELDVQSAATVVGVEHVAVRKGSGEVDAPSSVVRGETATFDVNAAGLDGDRIAQGVVVYDESTYWNQYVTVGITDDLDGDFDLESDSVIETSLGGVNGEARLGDDVERFGMELDDGRIARSAGIESVFDFVSESADADLPDNVDVGSTQLDASVTVVDGSNADRMVDVGTVENWSTGEYRWIYVAAGEDSEELYVDTATIQVNRASTGGGDDPDDGDDPDGDPGGGDGDPGGGDGSPGDGGAPPATDEPTATSTPTDGPDPTPSTPSTATPTETPPGTDTATATPTPTPTPAGPAEPPGTGGIPAPVIVIGVAVVAVAAGAAVMFLRS